MATVAGVDCSTQSTKVVVCDADTGEVLAQRSGPHPEGTEVDPAAWWQALAAPRAALLDTVDALAVGGQQHGLVTLDEAVFFFNATATTEIYTLSLHDALPI